MAKQPPSDFLKFIGTPFQRFILPIIPAGAKLSPESSLTPDQLGKIPGKWNPRDEAHWWVGFGRWQSHTATAYDLENWDWWQMPSDQMMDNGKLAGPHTYGAAIALGMRCGPESIIAIDIDVTKKEIADWLEARARTILGEPLAVRERLANDARRQLIYRQKPRTMPITKKALAFTLPDEGGDKQLLEVLGEGQQTVIEGPHASGAMHYWRDGEGLAERSKEELEAAQCIDDGDILRLTMALAADVKERGGEVLVELRGGKPRDPKKEFDIDSQTSPHLLPPDKRDVLTKAIHAIDINDDRLASYDEWFKLYLAICASTGRDMEYFDEIVLPWLLGYEKNTHEEMEAKWRSFTTSSLGPRHVYSVAARFGCKEAQQELHDMDMAAKVFGDPEEEGAGPGGDIPDTLPPQGTPLPLGITDTALRDGFIDEHSAQFRFVPNGDSVGWHVLKDGIWQRDVNGAEFYEAVTTFLRKKAARYRLQPKGAAIELNLLSESTQRQVASMLSRSPQLVTPASAFDTQPGLINTPGLVIDLGTMVGYPHSNNDLFLKSTVVSPDYWMLGQPEQWLKFLKRLAVDDPWLLEALQWWFGYSLTGYTDWELMLLICGASGSGKSLIVKVINHLAGTYSKIMTENFFTIPYGARGGDGRFEMDDIAGLRLMFGDETQGGSTFNETRLSRLVSGVEERVEQKNVRGKAKVIPRAKITIDGNHEPGVPTGNRTGGLRRRLLVHRVDKKLALPEAERNPGLFKLFTEVEGQQIMTWLLHGAHKALNGGLHQFLDLARPMVEAGQKYVSQDVNPHKQFELNLADYDIVLGDPGKHYVRMKDFHAVYQTYRRSEDSHFRGEKLRMFKAGMEEIGWLWGAGQPRRARSYEARASRGLRLARRKHVIWIAVGVRKVRNLISKSHPKSQFLSH